MGGERELGILCADVPQLLSRSIGSRREIFEIRRIMIFFPLKNKKKISTEKDGSQNAFLFCRTLKLCSIRVLSGIFRNNSPCLSEAVQEQPFACLAFYLAHKVKSVCENMYVIYLITDDLHTAKPHQVITSLEFCCSDLRDTRDL